MRCGSRPVDLSLCQPLCVSVVAAPAPAPKTTPVSARVAVTETHMRRAASWPSRPCACPQTSWLGSLASRPQSAAWPSTALQWRCGGQPSFVGRQTSSWCQRTPRPPCPQRSPLAAPRTSPPSWRCRSSRARCWHRAVALHDEESQGFKGRRGSKGVRHPKARAGGDEA